LNRHDWLRGTDGVYLFNLGYPGGGITAAFSFESVEDARVVYDELLAHRELLDRGRPMTFAVPEDIEAEPIWSGVALGDRCLVRVVSLGKEPRKATISALGRNWTQEAPKGGATVVLYRDGRAERETGSSAAR
jgi:hypothetical protein